MGQDLALPDRDSLAARLRQSFPTLAESLESDDALPYVPSTIAARALSVVDAFASPADHDDLTFALGYLASVTAGDKLRDPATMQVSARALAAAMREYPAAAALGAIREWPKTENGKWWPTENELRSEADRRGWQIQRLHRHLRASLDPNYRRPREDGRMYDDVVAAKLKRLQQALARGDSVKALRASGEL